MRVISGSARGRKLKTLEGMDTRPTTDRVKEGFFNIVQFDVPASRFLDLFSGSGQIGIEALSRGADYVWFNDQSKNARQIISENLNHVGFLKNAKVTSLDYKALLSNCKETFDIAYLDPPYNMGILNEALPLTAKLMSDRGIIVCEHLLSDTLPEKIEDFVLKKRYKYGKIHLSLYKKEEVI